MATDPQVMEALVRIEGMGKDIAEIKDSTKKISEAMVTMARIEERQVQDRDHIGRLFKLADDHDERLKALENAAPEQKKTSAWVDRVTTAVVTAVITAVMGLVLVKAAVPSAAPPVIAPSK